MRYPQLVDPALACWVLLTVRDAVGRFSRNSYAGCESAVTQPLPNCHSASGCVRAKTASGISFFADFAPKSPHFLSDYAILAPYFSSGCGALAPHFFTFWRVVLFFGIRQEGFGPCQPRSEKVLPHFLSEYALLAPHFLSEYAILDPHFVSGSGALARHFVSSCVAVLIPGTPPSAAPPPEPNLNPQDDRNGDVF